EQPSLELGPSGRRQAEDPAGAAAVRRVLALDQPLELEPAQLRVDLTVARGPEEAGRAVDRRLDLVARAGADREEPEDHRSHRVPQNLARRYIYARRRSSAAPWRASAVTELVEQTS